MQLCVYLSLLPTTVFMYLFITEVINDGRLYYYLMTFRETDAKDVNILS